MTTTEASPTEARDPLARTATTRRVGLAVAMLLAPWFIVAAELGNAVMTLHGGDDLEPSNDLALTGEHLTLDRWASLAALVGALLLVPAVLGVMRLVRVRAARLGLIGGVLTAAGYVCYFALVFQGFTTDAMVQAGGSTSQDVKVLQGVQDEPSRAAATRPPPRNRARAGPWGAGRVRTAGRR